MIRKFLIFLARRRLTKAYEACIKTDFSREACAEYNRAWDALVSVENLP